MQQSQHCWSLGCVGITEASFKKMNEEVTLQMITRHCCETYLQPVCVLKCTSFFYPLWPEHGRKRKRCTSVTIRWQGLVSDIDQRSILCFTMLVFAYEIIQRKKCLENKSRYKDKGPTEGNQQEDSRRIRRICQGVCCRNNQKRR